MSPRGDGRVRELERRWLQSGTTEDEVVYLIARQRAGGLDPARLASAAALGSPAALEVTGPEFGSDLPEAPNLLFTRFPLPSQRDALARRTGARLAGASTLLAFAEQLVYACDCAERALAVWERARPGEWIPRHAWRAVRGLASVESQRGYGTLPFRTTERFDELDALCREVRTAGRIAAAAAACLKLYGVLLGASLDLETDRGSIARIGVAVACVAFFAQDAARDAAAEEAWQRTHLARAVLHGLPTELRYSHTDVYTEGERVAHPTFGSGLVTAASLSRIEVRFSDRSRRLLHNRGPG